MAHEFVALGHEVEVWGPEFFLPEGRFDYGILANYKYTKQAAMVCDDVLVISHGIIPDEAPPKGLKTAYTSEEVRDMWRGDGPVIRQPINLDFWKPRKVLKDHYVTQYSYRGKISEFDTACRYLGRSGRYISSVNNADARDIFNKSSCVVASGRALLEAMACNVPVVLADNRQYQDELLCTATKAAMFRNYSGRGGAIITASNLANAIKDAIQQGGMRHHVETMHDSKNIAKELLCLHY